MTPFVFKISDITLAGKASKHILFQGELDESNVDHHAETFYELIKIVPHGTSFVLDGSELTYLNSKTIGYMTDWYNKIQQKGGKVVLVALKPEIFDILDIVGLPQIIPVFPAISDITI